MAGNTIDAKLRIAAEVQQAIAALKQLRQELVATGQDAAKAAGGQTGSAGADPAVRAVRARTEEERKAAIESRRLAKEKLDRDRTAAREAKRTADEETARRRRQDADERRRLREIEDARKKADRGKSYQTAALAPQLNDIFVGLTTGQSALQVALQQGPQITQIYGGVANTFKAVLAALTPMRVALGGAAAGFLGVAAGILAGYRESSQLRKELALMGDAAGYSAGQLDAMIRRVATSQSTAIGVVRDAAAAARQLAGQNSQTIESTTRAATALAKLSGTSAEEAVAGFKDQANGITDWSIKANRAYNFLTASQVAYIRNLERQGRVSEAIRFANEELAKSLEQRTAPALGAVEKAWLGAGRAVSSFWEAIKAIGRDESAEERLTRINEKLRELEGRAALRARGFQPGRRALDEQQRAALQDELKALNDDARRAAERTAAERAEQQKIKQESLEFRQALADKSAAEARRALASRESGLNREAALVEEAYARDVESAFSRAQKLNSIEQRRAAAQRDLVAREIELQRGLASALRSPEEVQQQQTRLTELQAQLLTAESRVAASVSEGKRLIDAEVLRLDKEVARAAAENAVRDLPQIEDNPFERARQTALAQTADARRDLEKLKRDLVAAMTTPGNDVVQSRLQAQIAEATRALNEDTRLKIFDNLLQQAQEQLQGLALTENALALAADQGAITVEAAEARKNVARGVSKQVLDELIKQAKAYASNDEERNRTEQVSQEAQRATVQLNAFKDALRDGAKDGLADFLTDIASGAKTAGDSLRDMVTNFGRLMQQLLARRLADQLVNQFLDAAKQLGQGSANGGNVLGQIASFVVSMFHGGGVIGAGGSGMSAAVSPLLFAGAQVLHSGGIAGAAGLPRWNGKRQVPIIGLEGEEMLTEDDPRHRNNYGGAGAVVQYSPNISITGAQGNNDELARAGQDLDRRMRAAMDTWAADNMRPGGVLASRR